MCGKVGVPAPRLLACLHVPTSLSDPPVSAEKGPSWGFEDHKVEIGNVNLCYKNLLNKSQKAVF